MTNDTAAHTYFTDLRTGERLMQYITTLFQGSSAPATSTYQNYKVEQTLYTYEKAGANAVSERLCCYASPQTDHYLVILSPQPIENQCFTLVFLFIFGYLSFVEIIDSTIESSIM